MSLLQVIYVMRNFKDVIVSNYNFFKCLSLPYAGTFEDFCQLFFENKCEYQIFEFYTTSNMKYSQ